jgi:NTP pyrophosphatase (non-canonical NTP hydrolase)
MGGEGEMTINELCKVANDASVKAGWQDEPRSVGDLIALMHTELSEAFEEYRHGHEPCEVYYSGHDNPMTLKPEGMPSELADTVIRIAQFCGQYGIDLEEAITRKMAYNETRGHRWEGKKL